MSKLLRVAAICGLGAWLLAGGGAVLHAQAPKIRFVKTVLDEKFRSEGVAVGDFNKDGKHDIAAGYVWYEAPDWKMHVMVEQTPEYDPKGYSNSFCTFAEDLNGDGWTDLIVIDFPGTPTWWFENPQGKAELWKRNTLTPVTNNESPDMVDLDGDGRRELILGFSPDPNQPDGPERQMAYATPADSPEKPWELHAVSEKGAPGTQKYSHGLGVGDVNRDGRNDILCADGWWESPATSTDSAWKFHAAPFGGCAHMHVYDYDGDGDNDVLNSSPHAFGIWWHEQVSPNQWKTQTIDESFSQTHSVCVADINGDGLPDFVTGKRWWAHAAGDPGVNDPPVLHWFELTRKDGRPEWISHNIDHASGVGTQFELADVNGDQLLDIAVSNKRGVFVFTQGRE
jgi:hypothetical protein